MACEAISKVYSAGDLARLDPTRIPHHVALIMDGNRRWALDRELPPAAGHFEGAETLSRIVRAAGEMGVKVLTAYAFSTENWSRPQAEVDALMLLFEKYLIKERESMLAEGVRLNVIGDPTPLPSPVNETLQETIAMTSGGNVIDLVLAVNYGGRDDIRRAGIKLARALHCGLLDESDVNEEIFASFLDTRLWPDPDLLIRTSGERRLSNFLLWQLSYAEVLVRDTLWPDFKEGDFLNAIEEFQKRDRRRGQ